MNDHLSTWVVSHLRGAAKLAAEDAATSERLDRQIRAGLDACDRERLLCGACGRVVPRMGVHSKCESCREREARAQRKRRETESPEQRAERLAKRRAEEKKRRERLKASGNKMDQERLARWRQAKRDARKRAAEVAKATRELEARGIILKGTGT